MCVQIRENLLKFIKFYSGFTMLAPAQYRRKYSNTAICMLENRKEYYDKTGQMICITMSPVSSHKLPLLVKFPHMTSYFRRMDTTSPYSNNSEGLFNGIYYILRKYTCNKLPIGNTSGLSNYGYEVDMCHWVKGTDMFAILKNAYKDLSINVNITSQCKVRMNIPEKLHNFRTDDDLKQHGKYLKLSKIIISKYMNQLHININICV